MSWTPDSAAAPVAVALASAALLAAGLRGRRVNEHPVCRRCGFDLVGTPADSPRCSECGADLRRPRAVRTGARRRHGGAVAAALLLLVPSLTCVAFLTWADVRSDSLVRHKPVWWLLNDACSRDAVARDAAFNEVSRRFRAGALSDRQTGQVLARALRVQSDPNKVWLPPWGDFVEEAYAAGKVPAEAWRRYVRQAPRAELVATGRFRRGERAWLELVEQPSRVGGKCDLLLRVHRRLTITDAAGHAVERAFGHVTYTVGGRSRMQGGWSLPLNEGLIGRLADGPQRARLEAVVEAYEGGGPTRGRAPVATFQLVLTARWTVDPAVAPDPAAVASRR